MKRNVRTGLEAPEIKRDILDNLGKFSSDRAIRDYCHDIWNIPLPLPQQTAPVR